MAPRSRTADYCEMHYGRLRRNGNLENRPLLPVKVHTGGYLLVPARGHRAATGNRVRAYEHRKVFFDAHGEGPHQCHVCGATISFAEMHVDHLDDDPTNNSLSNLAAACPTCNTWRSKHKVAATIRAQRGRYIEVRGKRLTLSEWARETGLPRTTLARRLKEGWTPHVALFTPSGPTGRKAALGASLANASRAARQAQRYRRPGFENNPQNRAANRPVLTRTKCSSV